jgi:reactive intermediate/imine deaminase
MTRKCFGAVGAGAGGQRLPFAPAVRAGAFVYVSGQIAMGENGELVPGGIEAQTRKTMENLEAALALAGCTLADVVKVQVWLDDPRDFWTFNRVYAGYFGEAPPARSTVRAELMVDAKVEIDCIAYRPEA